MSSVWQAALVPAEHAINTLLRHDPATLASLAPLQGQLIALHIAELPITVGIRLFDHGITLSPVADMANASLHGRLTDFIQLASSNDKANALIRSDIDLGGDTELVLALSRIANRLDIDWEALISPMTGGILAHQLGKQVRGLLRWGSDTAATNRIAVRDYLQDETGAVVHTQELDIYAEQVDQLHLATDRLAARLQLLEQQRMKD
ncbi:hypothetical protein CHH28_02470 [Bacterioplanes sanyensis]|uniref:Ubiquinone biosynthesis accessory factor UbiJ n=1 Tax=Bacterioplanes sanyensis TaxID=1249553 RepID=A0A222FH89_9GAMM|nr:SCP2 sterol-binding domain-containing protein [Bacterioplanes sanyensis]ASP37603.1 hypothetical protein CHH28_02470 [Bacterioplanes sanyensis]